MYLQSVYLQSTAVQCMCETRSESIISSKQMAQARQGAATGGGCSFNDIFKNEPQQNALFTSVIVPVSVRVPVLVLELTVVLGHKSDLSMQLRYSGNTCIICIKTRPDEYCTNIPAAGEAGHCRGSQVFPAIILNPNQFKAIYPPEVMVKLHSII